MVATRDLKSLGEIHTGSSPVLGTMTEIKQRPKDELIFGCHCGGHHFICFQIWEWDDCKEFNISLVDMPSGLWDRIKSAMKYIFKGGCIYYHDIGINSDDLNKVNKLINKYNLN